MLYRSYIRRLSVYAITKSTTDENRTNDPSVVSVNVEADNNQSVNNIELKQPFINRARSWFTNYLTKFHGLHENRPKRVPWYDYLWSFCGCFVSVLILASVHYYLLAERNLTFLIGPFGASSIIVFAANNTPLAQPRNVIGGHLLSALIGCIWRLSINHLDRFIAAAFAVSTSITVMQLTETIHPPGGAVALLAIITEPSLPWANFLYVFVPVLSGLILILILALLINNLSNHRTYPARWW